MFAAKAPTEGEKLYDTVDLMAADLTQLAPLTTSAVLQCLEKRYAESKFYTKAGSTIIAVNPFYPHPYLYDYVAIRRYHHGGGSRASSRHTLGPCHPLHQSSSGEEQLHRTESSSSSCNGCSIEELPPHVFTVAEAAYGSLLQSCYGDQSVIVSGESGAGKTVTASHIIKYLVTVANPVGGTPSTDAIHESGVRIEQRILDSGPILQAFGNAATLRNNNSSRFGKYIQLHFNRKGCVEGASIKTYLLEKTRVVYQAAGEYNFHVFYQLLQGAHSNSSLQPWLTVKGHELVDIVFPHVQDRDQVMYLSRDNTTDQDREQWNTLKSALATFGLDAPDQTALFKLLIGLLHLSAVTLTSDPDDPEMCYVPSEDDASNPSAAFFPTALTLLGMAGDPGGVEKALTHRRITASHGSRRRHSVFHKPCAVVEASERKDCLVKLVYARLFDWLVDRINSSISCTDVFKTIGILDIYGFESFRTNSLEQLCINFANEKLQQHFVSHFLKDMQEEYEREAIPWTFTEFVDNRPCLDLLEGNPGPGVFGILNEECAMNRSGFTDQNLERRILTVADASSTRAYIRPGRNTQKAGFSVRHYAGMVHYDIQGLLEKNKDNVATELLELLERSSNPFLQELFPPVDDQQAGSPTRKRKTVLAKFKQSVDQLMNILRTTYPHYIRCIKPNQGSKPAVYESAYVLAQLEACGVVETVNVSKQAYPAKMLYDDFHKQYSLLLRFGDSKNASAAASVSVNSVEEGDENKNDLLLEPIEMLYKKQLEITPRRRQNTTPQKKLRRRTGLSSGDHTRKLCASIMQQVFGYPYSGALCAQFGRTKIFLKHGQLEELEEQREQVLNHCACTIQYRWLWKLRQVQRRRDKAASSIQAAVRGFLTRRRVKTLRRLIAHRKEQEGRLAAQAEEARCNAENARKTATPPPTKNELLEKRRKTPPPPPQTLTKPQLLIKEQRTIATATSDSLLPRDRPRVVSRPPGDPQYSVVWQMVQQAFTENRKFTMSGAFLGLAYFEAQSGVLSRRRMPRVTVRFHTRINHVLQYGHQMHKKELTCSITDCLTDAHLYDHKCARVESLNSGLERRSMCVV